MTVEYFNEGKRIPSLDGMRAVAIGVVILAHALGTVPFLTRSQVYHITGNLGPLGVRLFFVISGFLITSILLRELHQTGTISLRRFYLRRAFRIFPAFYCFLGTILILNCLGWLAVPMADWLSAATYTINYREYRDWNLTHCWSLAVEEQFYLLWPLLLCLLGKRKALLGAFLTVILVPFIRFGTLKLFPAHSHGIPWEFQTVCDGLATGCLLAGFRDRFATFKFYGRLRSPILCGVAIAGLFLINSISYGHPQISALLAPTLTNLALAWLLDIVMTHPTSTLGRFLNSGPMVLVGVLSYSLYLWQQLFLHKTPYLVQSFPLNIALAFAAGCLSYCLVERPFLRLRRRFEAGSDFILSSASATDTIR